jgi:hypothetical protein
MMKDGVLFGQIPAKRCGGVQNFPQATNRLKGKNMRRTALYLGGLFLATGATLAMAAPAQAADGKCKKDYVVGNYYGYGADYGYGYASPVAVVPVGGYGYGGGYGGGYESNSYKAINQNGLVNVGLIDSPIGIF